MRVWVASVAGVKQHTGFVVDSGASEHMTNNDSAFMALKGIDSITIHLADNTKVVASKQETVRLDLTIHLNKSNILTRRVIKIILFIPEAAVSMLWCK